MSIDASIDDGSFNAQLLHLTSVKVKSRHDALARLKSVIDDTFISSMTEENARDLLLSTLTFSKIECKTGNRITSETSLKDKIRTATNAIKWALGILDKTYPRLILVGLARQLIGEVVLLCDVVSEQFHVELLSSLNLYVLNKREYLLSIDADMWRDLLAILKSLPRSTHSDRKEVMTTFAYFNLVPPSIPFAPLCADLAAAIYALLDECLASNSRSEEYTIMLALKQLTWSIKRLASTDIRSCKSICIVTHSLLTRLGRKQLFIDQEILNLIHCIEGEHLVKLDWHLVHDNLQLPSHFEQIDPLRFLYAIKSGTSCDPILQYMLSYLGVHELYAIEGIDENAIIKAKKVDASFVKAFYIGIRRGSFGASYISSCPKALPHMETSVLPWHLTILSTLHIEHLHNLASFFFRRSTSPIISTLFLNNYNPTLVHPYLMDVFTTQVPVLSHEFLKLFIHDFVFQYMTFGNFLWTDSALHYYQVMLDWLLSSMTREALIEYPFAVIEALLVPFLQLSSPSEHQDTEWSLLRDIHPVTVNESRVRPVHNERFIDYSDVLHKFITQFDTLKLDHQSMLGSILTKHAAPTSTLHPSRIPLLALVVSAVSECTFTPSLEKFVSHPFVQDYTLLKQSTSLLPSKALLVITQTLIETLESGKSAECDELFEGQSSHALRADPTTPLAFTFCLPETEAHTTVDILVELYKEMVKRHWSEEDSAFLDDFKHYLDDQITCSLRVCSRHFALVNKDKLAAFIAQRQKRLSPSDVASLSALLPIMRHLGTPPSSTTPIFPSLAIQCLELLWLTDASKATVACTASFPNAVKTFLRDKTLKLEHFSSLLQWNTCTKLEQIRTFVLMLRKSDADLCHSLYAIITQLDLTRLKDLIDDIAAIITEFLSPLSPLQLLPLMIETWLKENKQLTDFPVELFGIPPDPSCWTLDTTRLMLPFLVQTKNLDLAESFLPHCYAEYYSACLVHKIKSVANRLTLDHLLQIVALLVAWNREDLIPQACKEANIQDFDHRHVILLPLVLRRASERYNPGQYTFKMTAICSLKYVLLVKHAALNLLEGNPYAPRLLQMIVKARKTVHPEIVKECCLCLAEASFRMTESLKHLVVAFCKAMQEQRHLTREASLSIESVILKKDVHAFDGNVLLRLFEGLSRDQLKQLSGVYTERRVCSLLSSIIARRLHEFTDATGLKEFVLRYFEGHPRRAEEVLTCTNLAATLTLNLYTLLQSLSVDPRIEWDILVFLAKLHEHVKWDAVPEHVTNCFEGLKGMDVTLLPRHQHTVNDPISRQFYLFDSDLYAHASPALLAFPSIKEALHRYLLFSSGMSQNAVFGTCFQESLSDNICMVGTIRAMIEGHYEGPGRKAHQLSQLLAPLAAPILDQCERGDKMLGLYAATLLSEYKEDINAVPFLFTPELSGLTQKRFALELEHQLERAEESVVRASWLSQQWTLTDIAQTTNWDASMYYLQRQANKFNVDRSKMALQAYSGIQMSEDALCYLGEFSRSNVRTDCDAMQVERLATNLGTDNPLQFHQIINGLIGRRGERGLALDAIKLVETRPSLQLVRALSVSKLLWGQGRHEHAIDACRGVGLSLGENDPTLCALFLSRQIKWSFVTRSLTSTEIDTRFTQPLLELLKGSAPMQDKAKCYLKLSKYYDALYMNERDSEGIKHLLQLIKHLEAEIDACKRLMTKKDHEKHYDHLYSHLRHQLAIEKQALEQTRQRQKQLLQSTIECYLRVLQFAKSPKHEMVVYRLHSLWISNRSDEQLCKMIHATVIESPVKAFIPLMYQLAALLDSDKSTFQQALQALIYRMTKQHTPQCIYQLLALRSFDKKRKLEGDGRSRVAEGILERLRVDTPMVSGITSLSDALIDLSLLEVKQEAAIQHQQAKKQIAIPAKMLLRKLGDISGIPMITVEHLPDAPISVFMHSFLGDGFSVVGGINIPKVIEARGSDGKVYRMLVKGKDDVRQDAVMEQVFVQVKRMLGGLSADLTIRTYRVVPLQPTSGVLEWVQDSVPLGDYLMPTHDSIYPDDLSCRDLRHLMKKEHERAGSTIADKLEIMQTALTNFHPVMRHFFFDRFHTPETWYAARRTYTGSTATASIIGWIVGLGDRHLQNILLDTCTGQVIHIDLNMIFEAGTTLRIPERVPFRLTMNTVDGLLGVLSPRPTDQQLMDGPFGRDAQHVLQVLRKQSSVLITIIEVFKHDPLVRWSISPIKLARQLQEQSGVQFANFMESTAMQSPSLDFNKEAETALIRVRNKLGEA